jgi:hypothetical protein
MQRRSLRWDTLIGSLILIGLGAALQIDQAETLPEAVHRYWPVVLIVWGGLNLIGQFRILEDRWAGTDYGTGLYVIRHRRRRSSRFLPGLALLLLGGLFMWANFNPSAGITAGPIVLIGVGVVILLRTLLLV